MIVRPAMAVVGHRILVMMKRLYVGRIIESWMMVWQFVLTRVIGMHMQVMVDLDIVMNDALPRGRLMSKTQELVIRQVGNFGNVPNAVVEVSHFRQMRRRRVVCCHHEEVAVPPGIEELFQRIRT